MVVVFVAGFMQPATQYGAVLEAVASHGLVAVGLGWKLSSVIGLNYTRLARHLGGALDYVRGALGEDLARQQVKPLAGPRTDTVLLGAHSIGNHVTVRRLTSFGCSGVGGVVLVDPVDGADPYGIIKEEVIHPPALVDFVTPALHIETGLDPRHKSWLLPACAPAAMSNSRFFNAWRGPIWQLNATAFGHNDVTDSAWKGPCPSYDGDADVRARYRRTVAGALAAFSRALFGPAEAAGTALAALNGTLPTPVHIEYAQRALGTSGPPRPACTPA